MKKILYFLFLLYSSCCYAQLAQVRVSPIPSISQLPVSAISCVYEDSEGYMWYGTVDGLCRDDGYSVHVFRSDFHTPGLMDINSVLSIDGDRNNRIWFGTQKGVYILDKNTYAITKISLKELQSDPVTLLKVRRNGDIWISCGNILYELGSDGKLRKRHRLSSFCTMLFEDRQGNLYYATWNGEFYRKSGTGKEVLLDRYMSVKAMCEDRQTGNFWLLTGGSALWYYSPKAKAPSAHFIMQQVPASLHSALFREVIQDPHYHYLWILSQDHIQVFKPTAGNCMESVSTEGVFTPERRYSRISIRLGTGTSGFRRLTISVPSSTSRRATSTIMPMPPCCRPRVSIQPSLRSARMMMVPSGTIRKPADSFFTTLSGVVSL